MKHVAFLRGINVGGKNALAMTALAEIFSAAGCVKVKTYIQSGNVVFDAPAAAMKTLAGNVARAIESEHGLKVPIVVRTAAAVMAVLDRNPFPGREAAVHVMFLADLPAKHAVAALEPERSPGDAFRVVGGEIYLHLPNGVARTKLTNAYFDRVLGTVSTLRNWRTVETLTKLCAG